MSGLDSSRIISMVNRRGRIMWVHEFEVENLRRQGAKTIVNPRREYYFEYDEEANPKKTKEPDIKPELDDFGLLQTVEV